MWKKKNQEIVPVDFSAVNAELARFKTHISSIACPACQQKKLALEKYEQESKGWLAQISCENCNFSGILSQDGFSFMGVSSKGKAVDK